MRRLAEVDTKMSNAEFLAEALNVKIPSGAGRAQASSSKTTSESMNDLGLIPVE